MSEKVAQDGLDIGEKLRSARLGQNLSLRDLAQRAEVSASLISQIENGKANPSVRSLHSIADALSLPIDYFFPDKEPDKEEVNTAAASLPDLFEKLTPSELRAGQAAALIGASTFSFADEDRKSKGPVLRADARPTIELECGVTWSRLTPAPEATAEYMFICYQVGATSGARMSHHTGREFGFILEGELLLELGFEQYHLKPGDSVIFDSATPHRLTNTGQVPMRAMWVIFNHK
ncbi:MAG TPA: cupin domain-containing protein [Anaerolineae bacterium]|jgi:transcriptional regulator with XRE-family HTH domain